MRPLDLTPEWVSDQGLATDQAAQVTDALREIFFYAAQVRRPAPLPNPSEVAWEALRSAIRAQGISTIGLAKVSSLAIDNCMAPSYLTLDWTSKAAAQMDTPKANRLRNPVAQTRQPFGHSRSGNNALCGAYQCAA